MPTWFEPFEVSDILADGAYDEAVQGVEYVLHLASPLPDDSKGASFDLDADYLTPAIQGTVGILKSAAKSPTVKRVVITSSVTILAPHGDKTTVGPNDLKSLPPREVLASNPWIAYSGSKVLAQEAADKWIADSKPAFDVAFVLPAYVQGRNDVATSAQQLYDGPSSNHTVVQYVTGKKNPAPRPKNFSHVDDVAAVHVKLLTAQGIQTGERFIVSIAPLDSYDQIDEVVKKLFPKEVESGLIPLGGEQVLVGSVYETDNTKKLLGREFLGLESQMQSLVGQYIELLKKEKGE